MDVYESSNSDERNADKTYATSREVSYLTTRKARHVTNDTSNLHHETSVWFPGFHRNGVSHEYFAIPPQNQGCSQHTSDAMCMTSVA